MNSKKRFYREVLVWALLFMVMVLAPLALALVGHQHPSRGFWVEFGVGLGFVAIALMGLQFVLTARFRGIAPGLGTDALLNVHRQAGYVAYVFVLGHVGVLIAANSEFLSFFDPRVNLPRSFALLGVLVLLTLLVALTIWRKALRIPYEYWRFSHGVFAFLILFIGLAHILMVGFYISAVWQKALWILLTGTALALLLQVRIVKPWLMRNRPYRVTEVRRETDDIWTVQVQPFGHQGLRYEPGQFAWVTIGPTPFTLQQHPFSFSSAATQKGLYEFTIRELGDFSSTIKSVKPDTTLYLEGPYGGFILKEDAEELFFVAGGIGITPVMSMLRTENERGSSRPATLLYAGVQLESMVFRDALEKLAETMDLRLVLIPELPPENWEGPSGWITDDLLRRYLPGDPSRCDYFVCGPAPMMDLVEITLRDSGVPLHVIHSERFNIV